MCIIVLYIIYISLTIIKSLGHSDQKWCIANSGLEHCDFAVGELRLGLGHSGRGTFRQRGIPTLIRGILKGGPQLADRAETADHIHKDATDRYAPCLRALLLFGRPIVNIGNFYYCVVVTIQNVIPNGITCI